jgi:hypothetical protein
MKRNFAAKKGFPVKGRKLGGMKAVPPKTSNSFSDSGFRFFEKLPHIVLVKMSELWEVPEILLLARCSKTLNHGLSHNLVWQHRAESEIAEYQTIHPLDLKRMQREGFWKVWYLTRVLRPMPIYLPQFYKLHFKDEDDMKRDLEVLLPEVGSLCYMNQLVSVGPAGAANTKKVYYVVLEQKLNQKGYPFEYRMSQIETDENEALIKRKTKYRKVNEITIKCAKDGNLSTHMNILDITMY